MVPWVRITHRLFALQEPSSDHYRRSRETARELTVARVCECRHDDDLARVEQMLVEARSGWLYGLDRAFTRAERGRVAGGGAEPTSVTDSWSFRAETKGCPIRSVPTARCGIEPAYPEHPNRQLVGKLRNEREPRTRELS
jgi:hypothetical protein